MYPVSVNKKLIDAGIAWIQQCMGRSRGRVRVRVFWSEGERRGKALVREIQTFAQVGNCCVLGKCKRHESTIRSSCLLYKGWRPNYCRERVDKSDRLVFDHGCSRKVSCASFLGCEIP